MNAAILASPVPNGPDSDTLVEIYRRMTLIKKNDEAIRAAARSGQLNLIYYSPRGQEVIPAALSVHLDADDYLCTIYRGIHDQLAKGVPSRLVWAEYAGRTSGSCKGKGGPMHITYPEAGVMVTTGIVGSSMPIANGLALAAKMRGETRVTVASFGDGASNIGAFHEAMNLAAIWRLPVIFLCQNNLYSEHSKFETYTAGADIAGRARAYGLASLLVDGNDVEAMWRTAGEAVARARANEGPTLIEARTFRFEGHLLGDDSAYIPKAEMEAARAADPVPRFRASLIGNGHVSVEAIAAIDAEIDREVADARAFALEGPWPEASALDEDVYALRSRTMREMAA